MLFLTLTCEMLCDENYMLNVCYNFSMIILEALSLTISILPHAISIKYFVNKK